MKKILGAYSSTNTEVIRKKKKKNMSFVLRVTCHMTPVTCHMTPVNRIRETLTLSMCADNSISKSYIVL